MINLNNNGSTLVTVTLYEQCVNIFNPYFTWSLTRKGSQETIIFTADDISNAPYYYNSFTFSVATYSISDTQMYWNPVTFTYSNPPANGLTQGVIPIYPGEWEYKVYEQSQPYILSTQSAVGLVEVGLLIVPYTQSATPNYTNNTRNIPVYKNN
jgi:hypothetical protein